MIFFFKRYLKKKITLQLCKNTTITHCQSTLWKIMEHFIALQFSNTYAVGFEPLKNNRLIYLC